MSHTPGPWELDDEMAIYFQDKCLFRPYDATDADVILARAAPDLLEFAEWTVRLLTSAADLGLHLDADKKHLLATAQAAIKKAKS